MKVTRMKACHLYLEIVSCEVFLKTYVFITCHFFTSLVSCIVPQNYMCHHIRIIRLIVCYYTQGIALRMQICCKR
jgi:hypothetical protein